MVLKIVGGLLAVVFVFLGYVASRDGNFRYEKSGDIHAPAAKIFPYLSDFKLGSQWSPYEKADPNMKKSYEGADGQVGSKMIFESKTSGSGTIEILKIVPDQSVDLDLHMTAPFEAHNLVQYKLESAPGDVTRFTWSMSGNGGFMGKLMTTLVDCKKMLEKQFGDGIANLRAVVEAPQAAPGN